jgi:hypothetical protein
MSLKMVHIVMNASVVAVVAIVVVVAMNLKF